MYKWTICDPTNEKVIQKGAISKEDILVTFEAYPWGSELKKFTDNPLETVHYNPSIEFIDTLNKRGITFSAVPEDNGFIFYVFYMRPELVKKWFGFVERLEPKHVTDLLDNSFESSKNLLNMFLEHKFDD
ncbi:hypothetical protein [Thalassotalea mangrovi]|uniref:Uncharacterized protein n=1 Tax=Thalassotalea mangrovi TaxID=2572245 RepID=A0A4U1B3M4_9GAMM|nr:hypothetical protein [Thalassotalea mangrovi]TKB44126.1 hypothetical protein E8M12_13025 [Thalassotalea mangrovi]